MRRYMSLFSRLPNLIKSGLGLVACLVPFLAGGCRKEQTSGPAERPARREPWPAISTEEAGLDGTRLDAFAKAIGGHGVVIRQGARAYHWGTPDKPLDIASASKAVYSFLVLKAVEEGRIPSLDQPVVEWMPELGRLNPALNHKDSRITWRHLITQTSCYGVSEEPGSAFDYNDYQTGLLYQLIFEKVYKTPGPAGIDTLKRELFDVIQVTRKPTLRAMTSNGILCRLVISPLDLARFGHVFLNDGKWKDRQVISPAHVALVRGSPHPFSLPRTSGKDAEMLPGAPSYGGGKNQDDHLGCYSHMWWLNKRDRKGNLLFPSAPEDAFAAIGYGGEKVLMVVPSLDLIVSWNTDSLTRAPMLSIGREQMESVLKILFSAVKQPAGKN